MMQFMSMFKLVVVLSLIPNLYALGEETTKTLPGNTIEATTASRESYILEGKLLNIEGKYWVVEDMASNQHRIHVGTKTTLPQSPKQAGDSIQAVVRANGLALLIQ